MIIINRIIYTDELEKELVKHRGIPIMVGKSGDKLGREDRYILNTELKDGILMLNIENFNEDGFLKLYR